MSGAYAASHSLVHEAYVRLVDVDKVQHWNSRGHFFSADENYASVGQGHVDVVWRDPRSFAIKPLPTCNFFFVRERYYIAAGFASWFLRVSGRIRSPENPFCRSKSLSVGETLANLRILHSVLMANPPRRVEGGPAGPRFHFCPMIMGSPWIHPI